MTTDLGLKRLYTLTTLARFRVSCKTWRVFLEKLNLAVAEMSHPTAGGEEAYCIPLRNPVTWICIRTRSRYTYVREAAICMCEKQMRTYEGQILKKFEWFSGLCRKSWCFRSSAWEAAGTRNRSVHCTNYFAALFSKILVVQPRCLVYSPLSGP